MASKKPVIQVQQKMDDGSAELVGTALEAGCCLIEAAGCFTVIALAALVAGILVIHFGPIAALR